MNLSLGLPSCLLAQTDARTVYELSRLDSMTQWWQWLLLVGVLAAIVTYAVVMYFYDSVDLSRGLFAVLITLRLAALVGLLVFFLNIEKRSERTLVKNSRVILLVDTSLSMGLSQEDSSAESSSEASSSTRIDQVLAALSGGPLLAELRELHDVIVYRFDEESKPIEIASLPRLPPPEEERSGEPSADSVSLSQTRWLLQLAGLLFTVALLGVVFYPVARRFFSAGEHASWGLLASVLFALAAIVTLAVANLRHPQVNLLAVAGLSRGPLVSEADAPTSESIGEEALAAEEIDWSSLLSLSGEETRLGEALRWIINQERGGPVAGLVVFSDGNSNAGVDYSVAATLASEANLPIFSVGLGSDRQEVNVRVVELEAPQRAYPGDTFTITGYLQATGLEGRTVEIELSSIQEGSGEEQAVGNVIDMRRVVLGGDGEDVAEVFQIDQPEQGRWVYSLQVKPPRGDHDSSDNEQTATVEVVDRRNRVLLFAGGPTREYRFLRNMLFRDNETSLDVVLQSARGIHIGQDADAVLDNFPKSADQLFEYDCIVAFDPDWRRLSAAQLDLLERWVSEKAGGLIAIAGPVYTPTWARRRSSGASRLRIIEDIYPVVFYSRSPRTISWDRYGSETITPLRFTTEGESAEFLWLEDSSNASEQAWNAFPGVYGYFATRGPKAGAKVYAEFASEDVSVDGDFPIFMAGQFYGAGRVFYLASGEIWRIRGLDNAYFETFYTKLIRWASEGRLLRDSSRGVLFVDKSRCRLRDIVAVHARLTDFQHQPLTDEQVLAVLIQPDQRTQMITLRRLDVAEERGVYTGQFAALQAGKYRIELEVPHGEGDILSRDVVVRVPRLERENPRRNNQLLSDLASKTDGTYYVGTMAVVGRDNQRSVPVWSRLPSGEQESLLPGTPDRNFQLQLMKWLLVLISGVICLEWLIRRLSKLA